jgi:hypothetical protein
VKIFFFEIGHIGYQKIENFYADFKLQTYLRDKMSPKKVKIKNQKMGLGKTRKQFLMLTFFGGGDFVS